jgi:uncharacterized protein YecA (UPF0149 family)
MKKVNESVLKLRIAALRIYNAIGRLNASSNIGRNNQCWCLSGKKYKHCCMHSDQDYKTKRRQQYIDSMEAIRNKLLILDKV